MPRVRARIAAGMDPLDRYDFSPIERDPVAATVSPLPISEVPRRPA
jgi:hypothetical protein